MAAPARPLTTTPSGLVGREPELALVTATVEAATRREGAVLLLEGEAGIGKSALVEAACNAAWERGCVLVRASADELEGSRPFGLFSTAAAALGRDLAADIATRSRAGSPTLLDAAAPGQLHVLDAIVEAVEAVDAPILLAMDDVHWADPASLFAVAALGRRAEALGIGLVVAYRPTPRTAELDRAVDLLVASGAVHAVVQPLDAPSAATLLERVAGAEPGPRLKAMAAGTGGNPLLLLELVAALRDEGRIDPEAANAEVADGGLPVSLRATVSRRVRRLDDGTAAVLRLASILGQSFSMDELGIVTGRSLRDLVEPLRSAIAAGLLHETPGGLAFRHDLLRQAVADETPAPVRVALHRDIARALTRAGAPIDRVAAHLLRGAERGDHEAVDLLLRAARTIASAAPAGALELVDGALTISTDLDQRRVLAGLRAELLVWVGRPADAIAAATPLVDNADATTAIAAAATRSQALFMLGRPGEAVASFASANVDGGDVERCMVHAAAALATLFASDIRGAAREAEAAISSAGASPSEWSTTAVSIGLATRSWCRAVEGRYAEALEDSARAVAIADADEHAHAHRYHPNVMRSMVLSSVGDHAGSIDAVRDGQRAGREVGTAWDRPVYHWAAAATHFRSGAWDEALAEVDTGVALAEESGVRVGSGWPYGAAAMIAVHRGDRAGAARSVAAGETTMAEQSQQLGLDWLLWAKALLAEADGDVAGAQRVLGLVADVGASLGAPAMVCTIAGDLVRLSVALDDRARVRSTIELVDDVAARASSPILDGVALRCRGLAEDDADVLAAAVERFATTTRLPELAATTAEAAVAAAARGDLDRGRSFGRAAIDLYIGLDASDCIARVRAALRAHGVRLRVSEAARPAFGWESLTAVERDVAARVARGMTNGAIGAELHISHRTVETHVAHIYAKLGINSRTALTAEVLTRGP